jgi:Domain of unknown function (DUF222)/HNH endonuclease
MGNAPAFANATEAAQMARAALRFLAAADPTRLVTEEQAQCLQALEQVTSMSTAARASILGAFISGQGYSADADYSPRSWLIHRTRVTKGAAAAHTAWARRAAAHPRVAAVLTEGQMSESYARTACEWSDKLPGDCRDAADAILVAAALAGADLAGLAELAAEMYARSLPDTSDGSPDTSFEDRSLRVETTFDGAGVIWGDLAPECAAVVTAVLESLSAPAGAEDTRTREQRYHDGLQEAMRRLVAGGLLPERAGQPVKVWAHVSLAELRALDEGSVLEDQWITTVRARWAAARASASEGGSDGAAWLDGDAARAVACDASLTPIVSGDVDTGALEDLVRLCVQLDRLGHHGGRGEPEAEPAASAEGPAAGPAFPAGPPAAPVSPAREALERAIIGKAADLLSGPGGLASFLRTQELGARLGGPSLPLDVGYSENVPAGIRNAVIVRDRHCRWAGGCGQPAAACEVHHVTHKARGGKTSVKDCVLLCWFHHQVVIHRWGWTLVLNPDGTTSAWNPDRTKVLHSHSPPVLPVRGRVTSRSPTGALVTPTTADIAGDRRARALGTPWIRRQLNDTGGRGLLRWHELVVSARLGRTQA